MRFDVYGGFELPRSRGLFNDDREAREEFWSQANASCEGLAQASGCYIFALRTAGGTKPWYVGRAEAQPFRSEILTPHKINHYNRVMADNRGTPLMFLLPRVDARDNPCAPGENATIAFLETMLIGMAYQRNQNLRNRSGTRMLKELKVLGVINSRTQGSPRRPAIDLKEVLGM